MEIALGLGLAFLGKKVSEGKPATQYPMAQVQATPVQQSFVPAQTVTQDYLPTPGAGLPDRGYMFDRKLEAYTGGASRLETKTTPPALFTPTNQVFDKTGAYREAAKRFEEFSVIPTTMNNVSPIEKTQVGPGIGLDYFQTARTTGFQEMFRILPGNVNGYRRTTEMPGQVITGRALVSETQTRDQMYRMPLNDLSREANAFVDPIGASAAVHRPNISGEFVPKPVQKRNAVDYAGGAQGMSREQAALAGNANSDWGMYTAKTRHHMPEEYAGGASQGGDHGYGRAKFLVQPNQRTYDHEFPILGGYVRTKGDVQHEYQGDRATQRGQDQDVPVLGGRSVHEKTVYRDSRTTDKTQRGTNDDPIVLGGKGTQSKLMRPEVQIYGTHRDTMAMEYAGGAGRAKSGMYTHGWNGELNPNKPVVSNTPHAGRMNIIEHSQFGSVQTKQLPTGERVPAYARESNVVPDVSQLGVFEKAVQDRQHTKLEDDAFGLAKVGYLNVDHDMSRHQAFR